MVIAEILDVTRIEPKLKHPTIFKHFDELGAGESFIIDNDHDPKPLYYQLLGERGNIFTWEYLEQGPRRWQVRIAKRNKNDNGETVGAIAAKDMRKAEVFKAKGIDYSCDGNKTLKEAGKEAGISEEELNAALQEAENKPLSASQDFTTWQLDFLSDYISRTHHRYVKDSAKVISGLTEEVAQHHGLDHPELNRLAQSIPLFLQNLLTHISKEETVAFPAIRQAVAKQNGTPMQQTTEPGIIRQSALLLQKEHAMLSEDLSYIRRLTGNYRLPADACNSYTYLYRKLEEMENDLKQYMHVENNILFPRAMALEKEMA